MTSEAVLIECCVRLRQLESAIEAVDAYLAERQEFHMNRKEDYTEKMRGASEEKCKENMQRAHVQEQKEERIVNLRDKLLRAFECAAEDHRLLVEELRETQDTVRSIE